MRGCGRSPARTGCSCTARPAAGLGLVDDDWVWIESINGRVKGQIRLVDGVNPDTVWTWNAIGKRRGSLGAEGRCAPRRNRGFLLNHVIGELLPADANGKRYSNSDPVTGQAAWFDLRVRIVKCAAEEAGFTEPQFERFQPAAGMSSLRPTCCASAPSSARQREPAE